MNSGSVFTAPKLKSMRDSFEPVLRYMRGGANIVNPNTPGNVPLGAQLVETFVIVIVVSITMQLLESSFNELKKYNSLAVDVYPLTYNSPQTFVQDPSTCFPLLEPSNNERNGTEYSYSAFINISPENFTGEENGFRHIFHKGSPNIYPLMAPGVFFSAKTNTLRVYQNSSLHWSRYVDVDNIPLNKWFHLVVMLKGNALDVYINGNLANRYKYSDIPKLNYGNFYLLNGSVVGNSSTCTTTTDGDSSVTTVSSASSDLATKTIGEGASTFKVIGAIRGYVSRVKYFRFALTYAQIDKLLRDGPSKKIFNSKKDVVLDDPTFQLLPSSTKSRPVLPYYQTDDWWTSDSHRGLGPQ